MACRRDFPYWRVGSAFPSAKFWRSSTRLSTSDCPQVKSATLPQWSACHVSATARRASASAQRCALDSAAGALVLAAVRPRDVLVGPVIGIAPRVPQITATKVNGEDRKL